MVVTTVPNVQGSVVFLISLRQGAPDAPNPDVINAIVKTYEARPDRAFQAGCAKPVGTPRPTQ
jgi:hypothetical protein